MVNYKQFVLIVSFWIGECELLLTKVPACSSPPPAFTCQELSHPCVIDVLLLCWTITGFKVIEIWWENIAGSGNVNLGSVNIFMGNNGCIDSYDNTMEMPR
jgi:hypothetical protein